MAFMFHATWKETESKKLVAVEDKHRIVEAIKQKFGIIGDVLVQIPFEEDWLDVEELSDLPDGGKIRFLALASASGISTGSVSSASVQAAEVNMVTDNPSMVSRQGSSGISVGSYKLPGFPAYIRDALRAGKAITSRGERTRILQVLYDDLWTRVGWYVTTQELKTVCSTLVTEYPCLQDKIRIGQNSLRYETWYQSLRQKLKDCRRRRGDDPQVAEMKEKYGGNHAARKRKDDTVLCLSETPKTKRPCMDTDEVTAEDEHSMAVHVSVIQQQWKRGSACDWTVVSDRMLRTFASRREVVFSGAKLSDILEQYPVLQTHSQLKEEFVRMTKADPENLLQTFWTDARMTIVFRQLSTDKSLVPYLDAAKDTNIREYRLAALLCVMPRIFGDKLRCWLYCLPGAELEAIVPKLTVYPTVVIIVDDMEHVLDAGHAQIYLYFERRQICSCDSLLQAFAALFMLYFIFDVQYPAEFKNTANFLEVYLGRLVKCKIFPSVQRKLNILLASE